MKKGYVQHVEVIHRPKRAKPCEYCQGAGKQHHGVCEWCDGSGLLTEKREQDLWKQVEEKK